MKKKNYFLPLLFLIFLFSFQLIAQENANPTNFDISKFRTPDIVRNSLELSLYLNSEFSSNLLESDNANTLDTVFNMRNYFQLSYKRYINTRKKITEFNSGFLTQNNINTQNSVINSHSYNTFNIDWTNKMYFKPKVFFAYDVVGTIKYNVDYRRDAPYNSFNKFNGNTAELEVRPGIGLGIGRIENVEDARQALYLLSVLNKNGVLNRNMNNDEVYEFSQLISTVKNKRFLDSRLRIIEELTTLDAYLNKKDILADKGASYFTALYDMWNYGALFERKSGMELSFKLYPYIDFENQKNIVTRILKTTSTTTSILDGGTARIAFGYYKPFKLNWQHSFSAGAGYGRYFYRVTSTDIDGNSQTDQSSTENISGNANYTLGYYPSTRTNFYATPFYAFNSDTNLKTNTWSYVNSAGINVGVNYYFSPQMKINGSFTLSQVWDESNSHHQSQFNTGFGVVFNYLFF